MNKKTVDLGFAVCLMIAGITGIINGVMRIADIAVPDALRVMLGVISLIDVPVLVFFSVRKIINHRDSKGSLYRRSAGGSK